MNFTKILIAVPLLAWLLLAPPASAHELRTDGAISATLHVAPLDNPLVGQTSRMHLGFSSSDPSFSIAACDCTAIISSGGRIVTTLPLTPLDGSSFKSELTYTFTQAADYTLTISGQPRVTASFTSFRLSFPLTVSKSPSPTQIVIVGLVGGGMVVLIGIILWLTFRRPSVRSQP